MNRVRIHLLTLALIGLIGVALIVETIVAGAGLTLAVGYLVGFAFVVYAVARFMMMRGRS